MESQRTSASQAASQDVPVFQCEISSLHLLNSGLRSIATGKRDQQVGCVVTPVGITFVALDPAKCLQGTMSMHERHFDVWHLEPSAERCSFRLNLAVLMDCLGSLPETSLKMTFFDMDEAFCMQLIEGDVLTECKIRTIFEVEEEAVEQPMDFAQAFREAEVLNKAIVPSEHLRNACAELAEVPGNATVSLLLSPTSPFFQLRTEGAFGTCTVDLPHHAEHFQCKERMLCSYKLEYFRQACRALSGASKTYLRMNAKGMLSMQHMIQQASGNKIYVEYFLLCFQPDDDEDEDSDVGGRKRPRDADDEDGSDDDSDDA